MPKSAHSGATHIEPHQVQLDVTANGAFDRLDKSTHGLFTKALTNADYTLTADEAEQSGYLRLTGAFTANRTVNLPNNNDAGTGPRPKQYIVEHGGTGGFTLSLETIGGGGVTLTQATTQAVYCDGLNVVPVGDPTGAGGVPYDALVFIAGMPSAGALVLAVRLTRAVTFPATLPQARAYALTTATAATSFDIKRQIVGGALTTPGTVNFAIGANSGTFTWTSAVTYDAGDVLLVYAPGVQDATLADITITLSGLRS